jgi:signal transduction histidine kinase
MYLYDYKNAIIYNTKALKLKVDLITKAKSLNNIAVVNMEEGNYQKAIQILLPLTFQNEILNDSIEFTRIIENLGLCYFKINDSRALDYLSKALTLNTKNKYEWGLITSYSRLAEFYLKDNPRLAYKYSRLAYEKATKIKDINDRLISLTSLIKSSEGDLLKKHALDFIRINDSNIKAKQIAKNQFAKMKYDSKNEREENQKLKIEKIENEIQLEQQKNRVLLLFYFITTGIIATIGIFKYLYSKNKRDKIKTEIETENRISKKLHDEVANDLFQMITFAETRDLESKENKNILLTNLGNIYCTTRNISRENSPLIKGVEYETEIKELLFGFNSETVNILANGIEQVDWKKLDNIKKIIVYRVLQELLINMKKHSNCSLVMLIFKKNKNNLEINYSDNGAGAPIDEIIKGKGLQNVRNRILDVKGNITFESEPNKGFKSSIVLPF